MHELRHIDERDPARMSSRRWVLPAAVALAVGLAIGVASHQIRPALADDPNPCLVALDLAEAINAEQREVIDLSAVAATAIHDGDTPALRAITREIQEVRTPTLEALAVDYTTAAADCRGN